MKIPEKSRPKSLKLPPINVNNICVSENDSAAQLGRNIKQPFQQYLTEQNRLGYATPDLRPTQFFPERRKVSSATHERRKSEYSRRRSKDIGVSQSKKNATKPKYSLKFIARLTLLCSKLCQQRKLLIIRLGEHYIHQVKELEYKQQPWCVGADASFDASEFSYTGVSPIHQKGKKILTKPAARRHEDDIQQAVAALRNIKSFNEYSTEKQKQLAACGRFESYEPGRLILREGDPPQAFYLILHGSVLVITLTPAGTAHTACELGAGESFGELAIMNGTNRQSTIVAKKDTDLLSISQKDYRMIFMGELPNVSEESQKEFLGSLDFMKDWPVDTLSTLDFYEKPSAYYRNSALISQDSKKSEWLYIVTAGKADVLYAIPKYQATHKSHVPEKTIKSDATIPQVKVEDITPYNIQGANHENPYPERPIHFGKTSASESFTDEQLNFLSYIVDTGDDNGKIRRRGTTVSDKRRTFISDQRVKEGQPAIEMNIRTHHFLFIQTLYKGGVFGIHHLTFLDSPSLMLVSRGCECLLINRRFYRRRCPLDLANSLPSLLTPYPTSEELQDSYNVYMKWSGRRKQIVQRIVDRHCQDRCKTRENNHTLISTNNSERRVPFKEGKPTFKGKIVLTSTLQPSR